VVWYGADSLRSRGCVCNFQANEPVSIIVSCSSPRALGNRADAHPSSSYLCYVRSKACFQSCLMSLSNTNAFLVFGSTLSSFQARFSLVCGAGPSYPMDPAARGLVALLSTRYRCINSGAALKADCASILRANSWSFFRP